MTSDQAAEIEELKGRLFKGNHDDRKKLIEAEYKLRQVEEELETKTDLERKRFTDL